MTNSQRDLYINCIRKQLEEVDLLSSIYCSPGEMKILDPSIISDFHEFLETSNADPQTFLKAHLDFTITLSVISGKLKEKLDVRVELPHLYPHLENAIVIIHSTLLTKSKEIYFKTETANYISSMDKSETYVFQIISWIQDQIDDLVRRDTSEFENKLTQEKQLNFERLWIYSHHIKSKTKRHEIVKLSRNLDLTGFSRPGKPGIICVEGVFENTQEFWRSIKSMQWQKISVCKSEIKNDVRDGIDKLRRFDGFKEQLFCDDVENEEGVMDMRLFIKYLELHNSGYMKKELFGLE